MSIASELESILLVREIAPAYGAEADRVEADPAEAEARKIHRTILRLVATQRRTDWELLTRFRELEEVGGHLAHGCCTMNSYVALVLGIDDGAARERMRVARALAELPRLDEALREGRISYAKARAVTRVATPETEGEWLEAALELTAERLEHRVARSRKGEARPSRLWIDPVDDRMTRMVVELPADEMEMVQQAIDKVRREAGGAVSSSQALLYMAAEVLNAELSETKTADHFQVVVHLEEGASWGDFGGAGRAGGAGPVAVPAQEVGVTNAGATPAGDGDVSAETCGSAPSPGGAPRVCGETDPTPGGEPDVSAETRALVPAPSGDSNVSAETPRPPAGKVSTSCGLATLPPEKVSQLLCDGSVVAARQLEDGSLQVSQRMRTIPPATRRAILWRDGRQCQVPGCRNKYWLDLHHRKPWWAGGEHTQENLVVLCRQHHTALHEGWIRIEPAAKPGGALRFFAGSWEMGDGAA